MSEDEKYAHLRHIPELRACIGARLVDVTDTDHDELGRGEPNVMQLHFDNGTTVAVVIGDTGFDIETIDGPDVGGDVPGGGAI